MNLDLFNSVFPNYYDFKIPMWSKVRETKQGLDLEIVVPGYEKEDFNLYEEGGSILLSIRREDANPLVYDLLDRKSIRDYNLESISANYKAGVLKITIPKVEVKPEQRRIGIS